MKNDTNNMSYLLYRAFVYKVPIKLPPITDLGIILEVVCKYGGLDYSDIRSKRRFREIVKYRQMAMWLMKNRTNATLREIADMMGGFDHTTVISSVDVVEDLISSDHEFATEIRLLSDRIIKAREMYHNKQILIEQQKKTQNTAA